MEQQRPKGKDHQGLDVIPHAALEHHPRPDGPEIDDPVRQEKKGRGDLPQKDPLVPEEGPELPQLPLELEHGHRSAGRPHNAAGHEEHRVDLSKKAPIQGLKPPQAETAQQAEQSPPAAPVLCHDAILPK